MPSDQLSSPDTGWSAHASSRSVCISNAARTPSNVSGIVTASWGILMAKRISLPEMPTQLSSQTPTSYMSPRLLPKSRAYLNRDALLLNPSAMRKTRMRGCSRKMSRQRLFADGLFRRGDDGDDVSVRDRCVDQKAGGLDVGHDASSGLRLGGWALGSTMSTFTRPRWVSPGSATRRMMVMAIFSTPTTRSRASTARIRPVVLHEVSFRKLWPRPFS